MMKEQFKLSIFILLLTFIFGCDNQTPTDKAKTSNIPKSENFVPMDNISTRLIHGQSVYVPIYSSIYLGFEESLLHLTAILSIRNISPKESIVISQVDYYDTNGKLLKRLIDKPFLLGIMSTKDFVIRETDLEGGTGANFIVKWETEKKVAAPLIESIMLGTVGTKGFSFSSRGKEIEAH